MKIGEGSLKIKSLNGQRLLYPSDIAIFVVAALVVGGFVGFVIGATWQWEQAPQCRTTVFSSQEMRSL